jgi:anti-anti-sigma regulatory factor
MNITVEQVQARVLVSILRLQGDVDGSNYRDVIAKGQDLHRGGARHLLIDLGATPYMSSAGLVALHTLAQLFRGAEVPDPETSGWRAIRAMGDAHEVGAQPYVKLLNPQPPVAGILEQTGLIPFFETHTDEALAVASF